MIPTFQKESLHKDWKERDEGKKVTILLLMVGYGVFHIVDSYTGFLDSSIDKESTCNAGDPSSILGSGRSAGEGISYPLQYSWASLVAQLVKNLPAMWEMWV